jgi:DNA-binding transcriptional ArsR family regulator
VFQRVLKVGLGSPDDRLSTSDSTLTGRVEPTYHGQVRGVDETDAVFGALANRTRRELLSLLLSGPSTVQQLAAHFDMARPSVSEHLKVLRTAGLVAENKIGRERHYFLEPEPMNTVRDWLGPYEEFWRGKLSRLQGVLDEQG